ncbi:MAG: hypothetical protein EP335_12990 [Alphaproteobacteria bacterium]|nr:MAG: hypothetical protein EP335_12990 [Alphaproteobacteria bacterium]
MHTRSLFRPRFTIPVALAMAALIGLAVAPASNAEAKPVPMTAEHWSLSDGGASFETYLDRPAIRISRGIADLKDMSFHNGTIEFDIAMPDARGFAGVYFRQRGDADAEHFYLRSHLPGMPDANQYTPVFNGGTAWQLFHGPRYSAPTPYHFGDWTHVKLVVLNDKMDVYIDSDQPVLHVDKLFHGDSEGGIRLNGAVADYYFSNVRVDTTAPEALVGTPAALPALRRDLVRSFQVGSRVVKSADVEAKPVLDPAAMAGQTWTRLDIDEAGSANLARLAARTKDADTQLVRMVITSDTARTIKLDYGYSDRATLFLNGRGLAHGDNSYVSRDYRYLGTIGLFDSVFLPLQAGENELVIAISEAFGGWGIMAALDAPSGVSVQ